MKYCISRKYAGAKCYEVSDKEARYGRLLRSLIVAGLVMFLVALAVRANSKVYEVLLSVVFAVLIVGMVFDTHIEYKYKPID